MKFFLRMLFARRPAEAPAAQLGLFGGGGAPQPPPAPATGAREGVGAMHQVKTHTRVDAHGVHLVQQHQRVGKGHQAKPAGHVEEGDPLDPKALFRLGGAELRELLEKHKADPVARGKVQAELDRRAAKRAAKRGGGETERAPADTGHKLTDELVERVPGFDGGDEFRHGGHDWNVEQAGDNVEFHPVERGADADGLVEHLDEHGVDATAREEVVVATGVRPQEPEPEQPPQDTEQATKDRWEAIHQRLEDEREAMYAKMIGRGQGAEERKKLVAVSEDEDALEAHLRVETNPFVREIAEKRLAELRARRAPAPASTFEERAAELVEDAINPPLTADPIDDGVAATLAMTGDDDPVDDVVTEPSERAPADVPHEPEATQATLDAGDAAMRAASAAIETAPDRMDRGEIIADARKHLTSIRSGVDLEAAEAAGMSEAKIDAAVTKAKAFEKPDAARFRLAGAAPGVFLCAQELFSRIAAKPHFPANGTPAERAVARRAYLAMAEWLPKQLDACATTRDVDQLLVRMHHLARGCEMGDWMTADQLVAKLAAMGVQPGSGWAAGGYSTLKTADGTEHRFHASDLHGAGIDQIEWGSGKSRALVYRSEPATKLRYAPMIACMGKRFVDAVSNTAKRYEVVREGSRHDDKNLGWDPLLPSQTDAAPADTGRRPTAKIDPTGHRKGISYSRKGGREVPADITPDRLMQTFGFRGTQFGRWVNDEAAMDHVRKAHAAFSDLADVLGLDDAQLAHGRMLGMAFGARGSGNANAHYEPDDLAINLTHTRGGGTLAHEWGHFMDHVLTGAARPTQVDYHGQTVTKNKEAWATSGDRLRAHFLSHGEGHDNVHPEVAAAVRDVMTSMLDPDDVEHAAIRRLHTSAMAAGREGRRGDAQRLGEEAAERGKALAQRRNRKVKDGDTMSYAESARLLGEYWARPHEMFARAWESYVEDKLNAAGRENTYLVAGTKEPPFPVVVSTDWSGRTVSRRASPKDVAEGKNLATIMVSAYPQGEERKRMFRAFDAFVAAMREHQAMRKALARLGLPRLLRRRS